ncbi:bacteriohemerythrin [Maridesulfovibrio sp. FT414]|uniref:bacteriohemerythrin n=1 Tax=Maridesulfovibrio sp. FT414 TaxID=2979469 RepID=UPI003D80759C
MSILKWREELSVGVEVVDDEHRQLIAMINKAYDSVENMEEEKVLIELVGEMRKYALTHFATEERLMDQYGYPGADEHRRKHNEFMITAASSDNMISKGVELEPVKIFKYLADWLRLHILNTDKELGKYLNSKGVE